MNPFLKKEIRLLLPTFVFAVAVALASIFFHDQAGGWFNSIGYFLGGIFFPAVVIMLALNTFGVEVGTQTFFMMLAQPVTRLRIWQTKVTLLALAITAVGLVWYVSVVVPAGYYQLGIVPENQADILVSAFLFGLVAFSGSLWTVLLLRQVAAAFWFTLIVPGALLTIVAACCSGSSDEFILAMITSVLGIYSLAGFFFARWLFFRAQDLQWTGGNIVLPEWRGLGRVRAAAGNIRMWRPNTALWRKEIQLHQSQLVIAFVLFVLHLAVLAVRGLCDLSKSRDLEVLLKGFWVFWLVMPLLVGCAAVAEERKLGIHEGQLCLPVKRRTQFVIKLLVALGLSVFLGGLMPILLEIGQILPSVHFSTSYGDWLELLILPGIPALICTISFYVSTMARNTLQTLAPAALGVILVWPLIFITAGAIIPPYDFLWHGPLGAFIILPILAVTLLLLTYSNFQRVLTGWNLVGRNLPTIVSSIAIGVVLTSTIYHRVWEKLTPFEPAHGSPRLSLSQPVSLKSDPTGLSAFLPDGRIWTAPVFVQPPASFFGNFKVSSPDARNLPGTNWLAFEHNYWLAAGIRSDGTLWVSKNPVLPDAKPNSRGKMSTDMLNDLVQVGVETNWRSVLPISYSVFLVKDDGTLWRLGGNREYKPEQWPALQTLTIRQLGSESNWAGVANCGLDLCLYKTDGTAWIVGNWSTNQQAFIEIESNLVVHAVPPFDHHQMQSTATISHGLTFGVGIRNDGTFRIWAHERSSRRHRNEYEWSVTDQQIGTGTNWLAVAGNWDQAVTLKNDGTLWLWDFRQNQPRDWDPLRFDAEVAKTVPVRLGTHSDWIAISDDFALAADGSLWFWPLMDASQLSNFLGFSRYENNGQNWRPLLDISRKPQLLGNVFDASN